MLSVFNQSEPMTRLMPKIAKGTVSARVTGDTPSMCWMPESWKGTCQTTEIADVTTTAAPAPRLPCWPIALRRVRAWLAPWSWLARYWRGWTTTPPPPELTALLTAVGAAHGLNLYLPT